MSGRRFQPLIRCDVDGCGALVEPNIFRCEPCRRLHGEHPDAFGRPGRIAKPRPPKKENQMSKRADPPTRWKTIEELTVEEHLRRMQAMNRGEPEPQFESETYKAAKRQALAVAGLEPDDDGPPPNPDDYVTVERELEGMQRRRREERGEPEPEPDDELPASVADPELPADVESWTVDDHLTAMRRQNR